MKGTTPTKAQKNYHDLLARVVGCCACRKDGGFTDYVSIHHIDGRTKPAAHWLAIPLCAGHHQDGTGAPGLIAVHPWKGGVEAKYGRQRDLLRECVQLLVDQGHALPKEALAAAGYELEVA